MDCVLPARARESQRRHAQTPDERWKSAYTPIEFQFLEKLIAVPRSSERRAPRRTARAAGDECSPAAFRRPF
jgi:hypothetical protein